MAPPMMGVEKATKGLMEEPASERERAILQATLHHIQRETVVGIRVALQGFDPRLRHGFEERKGSRVEGGQWVQWMGGWGTSNSTVGSQGG